MIEHCNTGLSAANKMAPANKHTHIHSTDFVTYSWTSNLYFFNYIPKLICMIRFVCVCIDRQTDIHRNRTTNSWKLDFDSLEISNYIASDSSTKFFGMIIVEKLTWHDQFNQLLKGLSSACFAFKISTPLFPRWDFKSNIFCLCALDTNLWDHILG
jgi:hypothetical protein